MPEISSLMVAFEVSTVASDTLSFVNGARFDFSCCKASLAQVVVCKILNVIV